jgi:hypothetical protein
MIAQNDGSQNDFIDFDPVTNFVKVRQLVSLCHPGRAQAVIPEELNLSSWTSSICHPGPAQSVIPDQLKLSSRTSSICHPGLDPGSRAHYGQLRKAAMQNGSRVFARDDK